MEETVGTRKRYVKALLYGPAGAGKTRFCADAPKPYWFDSESSTETLYHWPEYKDIPVKKPASPDELIKEVKKLVMSGEVETIVIDSITTMLDSFLRDRLNTLAALPDSNPKKRKDKYEVYEGDYKYATQVFTDLFGFLQNASINVVIIGHERVNRNEDGAVMGIFPDVTPRLQQAVTRLVNVVGYLQDVPSIRERKRRLYLNRTGTIEAKNRLNIQETYIENPNWKEIFQ